MQISRPGLPLPDRPSIAVLPFALAGEDFEAQVFADGVTDGLTYALSCTRGLFVSGRNSAFAFKGRRPDAAAVGQALGVGHVLEGTVARRDADGAEEIALEARLREAGTGAELWSERFEGGMERVPAFQGALLARTVATIAPGIPFDASRTGSGRVPADVGIYARFLIAYSNYPGGTQESLRAMLGSLAAIARQMPDQPLPKALISQCYTILVAQGWSVDVPADAAEGTRLAREALADGSDDPTVLMMAGHSLGFLAQDHGAALDLLGRALAINPNSASGYERSGWVHCYVGRAETAVAHFRAAKRQSPLDDTGYRFDSGLGLALCMQGAFEEAIVWLRRAILDTPSWTISHRALAACLAQLDRPDEAAAAAQAHAALDPGYRIGQTLRFYAPSPGRTLFTEGMRKAGIPA